MLGGLFKPFFKYSAVWISLKHTPSTAKTTMVPRTTGGENEFAFSLCIRNYQQLFTKPSSLKPYLTKDVARAIKLIQKNIRKINRRGSILSQNTKLGHFTLLF